MSLSWTVSLSIVFLIIEQSECFCNWTGNTVG
ncbi:hypothetical protein GDO81_013681 [Engystomops pustulosus]|uniref:Uncharacterized protein n=1 Tax=Engystomops pustulosus TaxID=76066 RepID=A0AAV7B1A1_ENGPU|nr:hypothetical protein GDO81_013681 [Engystomops pustulosus]